MQGSLLDDRWNNAMKPETPALIQINGNHVFAAEMQIRHSDTLLGCFGAASPR